MFNFLFALAIVLMPFNDLPYFQNLFRDLGRDGSFYPFLLLFASFSLTLSPREGIHLPKHKSLRFIGALVFWIAISTMANYQDILLSVFKERTGVEKLLLQSLMLVFFLGVSYISYTRLRRMANPLLFIRFAVLISFLIVSAYSVFEISAWSGSGLGERVIELVNPLIRAHTEALYSGRVRSVCLEASWFAMYCSFALPWLISYLFDKERRRTLLHGGLVLFALCLILLSRSRIGYIITVAQLLYIFVSHRGPNGGKKLVAFATMATLVIISASLIASSSGIDLLREMTTTVTSLSNVDSISNLGRVGAQVAALGMSMDHPLFGVGFGQYGFYMPHYIPNWAMASSEVREWASDLAETTWPPVHSIYARFLAEMGVPGLLLWLGLWGGLLRDILRQIKARAQQMGRVDGLALALSGSLLGVLLSGLASDSFMFYGYWILLGASWDFLERAQQSEIRDDSRLVAYKEPVLP